MKSCTACPKQLFSGIFYIFTNTNNYACSLKCQQPEKRRKLTVQVTEFITESRGQAFHLQNGGKKSQILIRGSGKNKSGKTGRQATTVVQLQLQY